MWLSYLGINYNSILNALRLRSHTTVLDELRWISPLSSNLEGLFPNLRNILKLASVQTSYKMGTYTTFSLEWSNHVTVLQQLEQQ